MNHRPVGEICPQTRGPGMPVMGEFGCSADTDCDGGVNGRCNSNGGGALMNVCTYDECFSDTDCPTGIPCACRSQFNANVCLTESGCRIDSDCGTNGFCSLAPRTASSCVEAYYCHTANDSCLSDSDCADGGPSLCGYEPANQRWACASFCAIP